MKITLSKIFNFRPVRFLVTAFLGALLLFSNALPSLAVSSSPTNGEDQLKQIQKESEDVLRSNPRSLKEVQADVENGLNSVQGEANKNEMKNPANTDAMTVEERIDSQLKKVLD
ncbi:MAG: low temperature-induced protein [Microcoleaceae cyanobacterium]